MVSVIVTLIVLPILLLFGVVYALITSSKKKVCVESALVNNPVGSPTMNVLVEAARQQKEPETTKLSAYEMKIVLIKIELSKFLKEQFPSICNWEIVDLNNIAEDNSFWVICHFFSGEKRRVMVRKELTTNGFKFSLAEATTEKPNSDKNNDILSTQPQDDLSDSDSEELLPNTDIDLDNLDSENPVSEEKNEDNSETDSTSESESEFESETTSTSLLSAKEWIDKYFNSLVAKRKEVQMEMDCFLLEIPLPEDEGIVDEIKENLENKGFFFVDDEDGIKVYF